MILGNVSKFPTSDYSLIGNSDTFRVQNQAETLLNSSLICQRTNPGTDLMKPSSLTQRGWSVAGTIQSVRPAAFAAANTSALITVEV